MPLANFMDVKVDEANDAEIRLSCRLSANHNHLGTAFGGSLSALMILASYCRLFYIINGNGHVVVKSNSTQFFEPVHEDLVAVCLSPSKEDVDDFRQLYSKKGRGRLHLVSEIRLRNGKVAARMVSEFVGMAADKKSPAASSGQA